MCLPYSRPEFNKVSGPIVDNAPAVNRQIARAALILDFVL